VNRYAGRIQLIATIEDPAVIQRILAHSGFPGMRDDQQPPCSMTSYLTLNCLSAYSGTRQTTRMAPDLIVIPVHEALE
jgi:hypothetical protein